MLITISQAEKILQKHKSSLFEFILKENSFGVRGYVSNAGVSLELLRTYLGY